MLHGRENGLSADAKKSCLTFICRQLSVYTNSGVFGMIPTLQYAEFQVYSLPLYQIQHDGNQSNSHSEA